MFAVLHIADFALQAVLRTEPGDPQRPAALFATKQKRSLVLATTPAARALGIEPGMTAPQAVARHPALLIRAPSPAAEAEARAALLAVGFTLSPAVEDTAPGVCTVDLKGFSPESTEPNRRAAAAIAQLTQLGLPATAGIARTPLLALYAARAANPHPRSRYPNPNRSLDLALAEDPPAESAGSTRTIRSTRTSDPEDDGVLVVTAEKAFLRPLPLATADPTPELAPVLASWGLRTLGDLTALPRDEIVLRLGREGVALWQRATGGDPRPLRPVVPAPRFTATMAFEEAVETLEPLLFILRRILDRLTLELRAAQLVAAEVELALRLDDDTRHPRSFRLPEPTADAEILFRALHTHLESLRTDAAIHALELQLTPVRPLVRQHGLFDTGLRDPHGFAETLARVSALVDAGRVGTPQPEDTHRPDAVKLTPPPAIVPPPAAPSVHAPFGLPLRRFRPPLPANLEFTHGERQPTYIWTEHFHGPISYLHGPWRSSGDWWENGRRWARTEWDIALANGGLYRLLLIDEAWFIEGEYD